MLLHWKLLQKFQYQVILTAIRELSVKHEMSIQLQYSDTNLVLTLLHYLYLKIFMSFWGVLHEFFLCFDSFTKTLSKKVPFIILHLVKQEWKQLKTNLSIRLKLLQMKQLCSQEVCLLLHSLSDSQQILSRTAVQSLIKYLNILGPEWQYK